MYLTETGWVGVECTNLADKSDRWLTDVITAMNFMVSSLETVSFQRRTLFHGVNIKSVNQ